jgi:hypothetical protein
MSAGQNSQGDQGWLKRRPIRGHLRAVPHGVQFECASKQVCEAVHDAQSRMWRGCVRRTESNVESIARRFLRVCFGPAHAVTRCSTASCTRPCNLEHVLQISVLSLALNATVGHVPPITHREARVLIRHPPGHSWLASTNFNHACPPFLPFDHSSYLTTP